MTKVKKQLPDCGGTRGLLVARGAARTWSTPPCLLPGGEWAQEVLLPRRYWEYQVHTHALRPEESQDAAGPGAGPRRV